MKSFSKKLCSFLILLCLILSCLCAGFIAQAATLPEFTVSSVYQARPGDIITVTVDANENRGYCAGEFILTYDDAVLTPVSIAAGEAASEYFASNTAYSTDSVFFAVISEELMNSAGTVATITFATNDDTVLYSGDISLSVNSLVGNIASGYGLNAVRSNTNGGKVHIAPAIYVPDSVNPSEKEELKISGHNSGLVLLGSTFKNLTQQNISSNFSSLTTKAFSMNGAALSADSKLTTGCQVRVFNGSSLVDTFTVSVKADVSGDYEYDAEDAYLANLVASGFCSAEDLSPERADAADADSNGIIDSKDVELLEQNGLSK